MATRKKKYPELELPGVIAKAIADYVGPRAMNQLDSSQRKALAEATQACSNVVGSILEGAHRSSGPGQKP